MKNPLRSANILIKALLISDVLYVIGTRRQNVMLHVVDKKNRRRKNEIEIVDGKNNNLLLLAVFRRNSREVLECKPSGVTRKLA